MSKVIFQVALCVLVLPVAFADRVLIKFGKLFGAMQVDLSFPDAPSAANLGA